MENGEELSEKRILIIRKNTRRTALAGCLGVAVLVFGVLLYFFYRTFFSMDALPTGKLSGQYRSPDGHYTINIFLCNGGATTDYAIRGEVSDNETGKRKNIYWQYKTKQAEVKWIDDKTVSINGNTLDVRKDRFDYRRH